MDAMGLGWVGMMDKDDRPSILQKGGRTSGHVHRYRLRRRAHGGAHRHNKFDFGAALAMGEFANGLLEQLAPR